MFLDFLKSDLIWGGCFMWNCFFCWIAVTRKINGVLQIKNSPVLNKTVGGYTRSNCVPYFSPEDFFLLPTATRSCPNPELGTLKLISIWPPVKIQQDDENRKGVWETNARRKNTGRHLCENTLNAYITCYYFKIAWTDQIHDWQSS